jgi:TPP-dependent pyruvate/acetoin dehydrogenase alpha subunit
MPYKYIYEQVEAFAKAEKKLKPNWKEMFTEVYDEMPKDLR